MCHVGAGDVAHRPQEGLLQTELVQPWRTPGAHDQAHEGTQPVQIRSRRQPRRDVSSLLLLPDAQLELPYAFSGAGPIRPVGRGLIPPCVQRASAETQ